MKNNSIQHISKYENILAIVSGFLILFLLLNNIWFIYIALILGLPALVSSKIAKWINTGWIQLTKTIGNIVSFFILSLIFYLLLSPIAFLYRLTNKKKLFNQNRPHSMFLNRYYQFKAIDFKNPW